MPQPPLHPPLRHPFPTHHHCHCQCCAHDHHNTALLLSPQKSRRSWSPLFYVWCLLSSTNNMCWQQQQSWNHGLVSIHDSWGSPHSLISILVFVIINENVPCTALYQNWLHLIVSFYVVGISIFSFAAANDSLLFLHWNAIHGLRWGFGLGSPPLQIAVRCFPPSTVLIPEQH